MEQVAATNKTKGTPVAARVNVARSMWARFWGLMGKRGLADDEALLIDPCSSVHTMFMRFPIDVVYLSKENAVVKIAPSLGAWRASLGGKGAHRVLEMPAGAAARTGLEVGDEVEFGG
jgi:uncharacterized membrane protein (UPF0127 family)